MADYVAGKLRHFITIQVQTRVDDGRGSWTNTYTDLKTIRGFLKPASSRDVIANGAENAPITHKLIVRTTDDITQQCRLKYGNRVFEIIGSPRNVEERNRWFDIDLKEDVKV